jgi:hypothetical protein
VVDLGASLDVMVTERGKKDVILACRSTGY